MRQPTRFASLVVGVIVGVSFVLSCGDDSSVRADADSCNCPAAEPPIPARIVNASNTQDIAANARGGQGVGCPAGAKLLTGSCTTATLNPLRDVTLEQSGFYEDTEEGWHCRFKNNENAPVTVKVTIRCLMEAP